MYSAIMEVPHYWTADQVGRQLDALAAHNRHQARTVRLHGDLVQLFTNWPSSRSPRDKVVGLAMRSALRHIADGIEWADLDEESPGTGRRRAGAHSLRHSAARHWLMVGKVPLNVVSQWLGHSSVQVTLKVYLPIVGSDHGMDDVP